jgi:hypothetical protein
MVDERRRIALVAVVVAACGLVAMAARSDLADGTAAAFALDRRANSVAGVAIGAITLLAVVLVVWASWDRGRTSAPVRRRSWRDTLVFLIAFALIGLLLSTMDPPERRSRDRSLDDTAEPGSPSAQDEADAAPARRASATGSVLIAAGALVVLSLAVAATRSRRELATDDATVSDADHFADASAPAGGDAIAAAVAAAHAEREPRASIVLAYRAAEIALRGGSFQRPPSVAPREWLAAIRRRAGATSDVHVAMRTLTERYEIARFSTHAPTALDRGAALEALDVVARRPASSPA